MSLMSGGEVNSDSKLYLLKRRSYTNEIHKKVLGMVKRNHA